MHDLYFYIYSSIPRRVLSQQEIQELLTLSRAENQKHQITGMLLLLNEMYVQLIEGAKDEIDQLYLKIRLDPRHMYVETLKEGWIAERYFADWQMGFDSYKLSLEQVKGSIDIAAEDSIKLVRILEL
jgi:hypothetical protein